MDAKEHFVISRLALFDCDGTLVDGQHSICAAMTQAFEAEGLAPPARAAILDVVGLSLPVAMARLLPDLDPAAHDMLSDRYKQVFQAMRQAGGVQEPLFDGMADLIARLDGEGWMLGVATGKSDRGLALVLAAHGLSDRFVTLQTADRHPSKPHPSMIWQAMADAGATPETTVMIGDTSYDVEMGLAAGCRTIGVGWGYHLPDHLHACGAHALAMDMDELYRHIAAA